TASMPSRYMDELGRSDAEVYLTGIYDGSIIASKYMRQLAEIMLPRFHEEYHGFFFSQEKAERVCRFVEDFCLIPEGEKMWQPFVMEPFQKACVQLAYGFVDEEGIRQFQQVVYCLGRKNGKALSLDTEIPTPEGWRTMRDIHPGDYVFGQDGKPSKVLVESEIFDKPMYLVVFADHATVKASGDHVWTVRSNGRNMDVTTDELMTMVRSGHVSVPMCGPVEYACEPRYVNMFEVHELVQSGRPLPDDMLTSDMSLRSGLVYVFVEAYGVGLRSRRTPAEPYDLSCVPDSQVWQLVEVASSLGMLATASVDGYRTYHVTIYPIAGTKQVVSVTQIPNEPSKCIAIDNPSHLYLAGRQYTATHNSSLTAGLGLYHLTSDGEKGAEVYCCATSETQARKVFGAANEMAMHSPALSKRIRRGMSQKTGRSALNYDAQGSMLTAIAASPKRRDGASCSALLYDELAAVEDNGYLLDQIEESMSARRNPMTWILSSENFIRDGIWDERISYCKNILDGTIQDDTVLPLLFVQDDRSEVLAGFEAYERGERPDIWLKANPGLYAIKDVNKLAQRVRLSVNSPRRLPSVLTKEFCLRSGSYSAFLDIESCINNTPIDFDKIGIPPYVCCGFDLATKNDLCAFVCRWRVPGDDRIYELAKFWVASDMLNMQTDSNQKDNVPYLTWSSQGQPMDGTVWHYVEVVEGDRVNQSVIIDMLNDLVSVGMYPYCVAYDGWHVDDYTDRTIRRLVGDSRCFAVPQTARVLSPLIRTHELDLKAHKVICPNVCLHHSRQSLECREDNGGNLFPKKKDLQPNQKIDGVMSELFALAAEQRYYESYMSAIGWISPDSVESLPG
ncbi:MAG: hypothetical protein IKE22_01570, partial [Atopobiaceae bacterium]|nr:hypothetical protein [Atopobiaceae bacterium]